MRMPTGLPVRVFTLLLAALAVIPVFRAQTAYAQSPSVSISFTHDLVGRGLNTRLTISFNDLPDALDFRYQINLERNDSGTWSNANSCSFNAGPNNYLYPERQSSKVVTFDSFSINSRCQTGSYRATVTLKDRDTLAELASGTKGFTVFDPPYVEVGLGSTSLFRGTSGGVTMKFYGASKGQTYRYRAYVMQRSPRNYADSCAGSGLGGINDTFALGTVDEFIETRSGQTSGTCPIGDYTLYLDLYDSTNNRVGSATADFSVVTDPSATPSTQIAFAANSDDADTAIDVTISFLDLQGNTSITYSTSVTQRSGGADADSCEGTSLGHTIQTSATRNPYVINGKIPSACPNGQYRLTATVTGASNNVLTSGSKDFNIPYSSSSGSNNGGSSSSSSGSSSSGGTSGGGGGTPADPTPTSTPTSTSTSTPTSTTTSTPTSTPRPSSGGGGGGTPADPTPTPTPTHTSTPTYTPTSTPRPSLGGGGNSGRSDGSGGGGGGGGSTPKGGGTPGGGPPVTYTIYQPPLIPQQQQTGPVAVTQPLVMNVRSGPGLDYGIVTQVPRGTRARIIGLDPGDDWYLVEIAGVGGQVWIYQDLTTLEGTLVGVRRWTLAEVALLPGGGSRDARPLAVTVPFIMNVRTGPGLDYDVVRTVPAGTRGYILGIDPSDSWFQIELDDLDTLAWVYQDLTTVIGSLIGVKRVTETEIALLPAAITQPYLLNVRSGPGLTYNILTTLPQGTWTQITGVDALNEWYRVKVDGLDQTGWIYRSLTKMAGGSLPGRIQIASGEAPEDSAGRPAVDTAGQPAGSITVALSLPLAGGVNLEVSWIDSGACTQLYRLYHRPGVDSGAYLSLEAAATATSLNSRNLRFASLNGDSLISAWCGTNSAGRKVAEVEINPRVEGTYSSVPPSDGGLATVPSR